MNYDALVAFTTFAEHLNFTHAAEALHISQPALHAKVNRLADDLGVELYAKRGRNLHLTDAGRRVTAYGHRLADLTDELSAELREEPSRLVLASGTGAFLYLLGPTIRAAGERFELRLQTMAGPAAVEAVREGRAHAAVAVHGAVAGLESVEVRSVGQMAVVTADNPLARESSLDPTDLEGHSLIVAPTGRPHRAMVEQVLAERRVSWKAAVEATGWALMLRFVQYGVGVAIVNDFCELPEGLAGIELRGFPPTRYELFIRERTQHEGARWLFNRFG